MNTSKSLTGNATTAFLVAIFFLLYGTLASDWTNSEPTVDLSRYKSIQQRPGQRPDVAVAVAISGGGYRSAMFALGVLRAFETVTLSTNESKPKQFNLLNEVDYFSTVSGGGFAAGAYVSSLHQYLDTAKTNRGYSLRQATSAGGLTLDGRNTTDPRLLMNLRENLSWAMATSLFSLQHWKQSDRGDSLELALDRYVLGGGPKSWDQRRSITLGDIFVPKDSKSTVRLPMWIANATVYETGSIFPFSPDILEIYRVTGYTHGLKKTQVPADSDKFSAFPMSVAMKASASFPTGVPATTLSCSGKKYLHLFNGGLSANIGILTAIELLKQDSVTNRLLIVIDAYRKEVNPFSDDEGSPTIPKIVKRTTGISLDGQENRYRKLYSCNGFDQIVIDFRRIKQIAREDSLHEAQLVSAYTFLQEEKTDLSISSEHQKTLIEAGQTLVEHDKALVDTVRNHFAK